MLTALTYFHFPSVRGLRLYLFEWQIGGLEGPFHARPVHAPGGLGRKSKSGDISRAQRAHGDPANHFSVTPDGIRGQHPRHSIEIN